MQLDPVLLILFIQGHELPLGRSQPILQLLLLRCTVEVVVALRKQVVLFVSHHCQLVLQFRVLLTQLRQLLLQVTVVLVASTEHLLQLFPLLPLSGELATKLLSLLLQLALLAFELE